MLAARAENPGLNLNGRKAPKGVGAPRTQPCAPPRWRRPLLVLVDKALAAQQGWQRQQRAQEVQALEAHQLREPTPRLVG